MLMKKQLRFYAKNGSHFDVSNFYIINRLAADVNVSKTAIATTEMPCNLKEDYMIINKTKGP